MDTPRDSLRVTRWLDVYKPGRLIGGIEAIFFETAGTQMFADAATRAIFRERWLGRYLAHDAAHVWLVLTAGDEVAGYLVGSLDDPARTERFADIGYFASLAQMTRQYPAHLHINLGLRFRSSGAGSRLIGAFVADAARHGAAGVHVVTALGMRNVGFYARNGFPEVARITWQNRELVMLGRAL